MRRRTAAVVVAVLLLVVVAAAWWPAPREGATWQAVGRDGVPWQPGAAPPVDPGTTRLRVQVSPTGCTSGRVDDLSAPRVEVLADRMVVTYTVAASSSLTGSAQTCQGAVVEQDLVLPEPIGHRRLVDGTCATGEPAPGATECVRVPAP